MAKHAAGPVHCCADTPGLASFPLEHVFVAVYEAHVSGVVEGSGLQHSVWHTCALAHSLAASIRPRGIVSLPQPCVDTNVPHVSLVSGVFSGTLQHVREHVFIGSHSLASESGFLTAPCGHVKALHLDVAGGAPLALQHLDWHSAESLHGVEAASQPMGLVPAEQRFSVKKRPHIIGTVLGTVQQRLWQSRRPRHGNSATPSFATEPAAHCCVSWKTAQLDSTSTEWQHLD